MDNPNVPESISGAIPGLCSIDDEVCKIHAAPFLALKTLTIMKGGELQEWKFTHLLSIYLADCLGNSRNFDHAR